MSRRLDLICPRCHLMLGVLQHTEADDCIKALAGRLRIAESRMSAAQAEKAREKARRRTAQAQTVPSLVRRMERLEAELRRVEEVSRGAWNRSEFVVTQIAALTGKERPCKTAISKVA